MTRHFTLFSAQASNATSTEVAVEQFNRFNVFIKKTGAGAATVNIEAKDPTGDWNSIHERVFSGAGFEPVQFEGPFMGLRAVLTGLAGGSVTATMTAQAS